MSNSFYYINIIPIKIKFINIPINCRVSLYEFLQKGKLPSKDQDDSCLPTYTFMIKVKFN